MQCNRACHHRRGKRSTSHYTVVSAYICRIRRTGCYHIRIFTVIGIRCKLPTIFSQCAYTNDVRIRRRIGKRSRCVITCCCYTNNVAIYRKLRCFRKGIYSICTKRHIHDLHIALNGIIEPEYEIGSIFKVSVFIALGFDDNDIHFRRNTHHAVSVHCGCNYTRYGGTMSLFILD